jgi:hypothetical protein
VSDQEAISYLLRENSKLAAKLQRCRAEVYRQRHRAELWQQRALKRKRR